MLATDPLAPWLLLREAADAAARSEELTTALRDALGPRAPLRAIDLATGTGSNVRFLADRLSPRQQWLIVDRSPALLAEARLRIGAWATARGFGVASGPGGCAIHGEQFTCEVETRACDLGPLDDPALFTGRHLVAASALLDLVSERWLDAVIEHCRAAGAAVLFTITYNGRSSCRPAEPEDDMVRHLLNAHQKRDKGLGGPALGPAAAGWAEQRLVEAGYVVRRAASDWALGPEQGELQRQLIEGWAAAAREMAPDLDASIARWMQRRLEHVDTGRSEIAVGHDDLAAWLPVASAS